MNKEKYGSPAEEQATKILAGIKIIQKYYAKVSLIGLDKGVFVGPCYGPKDAPYLDADVKELQSLGWSWSQEQGAWEFYTGHG
jgi:hypothetical protein